MAIGAPADDEVQIRGRGIGPQLPRRADALGMYPGTAAAARRRSGRHGFRRRSRRDAIQVGDEVLALTPRGFCCSRQHARGPGVAAADVAVAAGRGDDSDRLSHRALRVAPRGRDRSAGERVLIHAGAGGVGIAAIQLAQHAGAEIFATAGSPEKRAFLRTLGVHTSSTRGRSRLPMRFAAQTRGEGIDIGAELAGGRVHPAQPGAAARRGSVPGAWQGGSLGSGARRAPSIRAFDTSRSTSAMSASRRRRLVEQMYGELMPLFESGVLEPLPSRSYAIDEALDAFRFMAQARHIGKIVLWQQPAAERAARPGGWRLPGDGRSWRRRPARRPLAGAFRGRTRRSCRARGATAAAASWQPES